MYSGPPAKQPHKGTCLLHALQWLDSAVWLGLAALQNTGPGSTVLCLSALATYLGGVRMLALQLLQVQLIDLPEHQELPIQELHLLLHRLTIGELSRWKRESASSAWQN